MPPSNFWIKAILIGVAAVSRPFSTINTFETRDEAVSHCFQFGRRIIDGSEPGLSVVDMA